MATMARESEAIGCHWKLWAGLGLIVALLGLAAMAASLTVAVVELSVLGSILVLSGIVQAGAALRETAWRLRTLLLLTGIMELVVGALLVAQPIASAVAVTMVVSAFLVWAGMARVVDAMLEQFAGWPWMVLAGLASIMLGVMALAGWPREHLAFVGMALGLHLLLNGAGIAALALQARMARR